MDCVLEHEVAKVLVGLDEVVEHLKVLKVTPLTVIENIEAVLVCIQLHVLRLSHELVLLVHDCLVTLLQLLVLFLKRADLLVYLLLHHSVEILLLDLELLHDASEGLF